MNKKNKKFMTLSIKQELETSTKYYKVEFSTGGKSFKGIVKFYPGDRHWIGIFPDGNNFMVRKEPISQILLDHGEETYKEVFLHLWEKVKLNIDGQDPNSN